MLGLNLTSRFARGTKSSTTLNVLLSKGSRIFSIPAYQRVVRWCPRAFLLTTIKGRGFSSVSFLRNNALTSSSPAPESEASTREQQPAYEMTFTCKKCETRSTHRISKQGYHKGTVLVQCPGCKNRHLIADHLKIFSDKSVTLEDILKEKGQLLKTGHVSAEGDVEFWDDGSQSPRAQPAQSSPTETK